MSKKRRPGGPAEPGSAEQPTAEQPAVAKPAARVSLPAFGFAAEVLAARDRAKAEPAPGPTRSKPRAPAKAAGRREPVGSAALGPRRPAPPLAGPERIFAFADSLAAEKGEEAEAAPVVLETWVTLSLYGEIFALPVDSVREVLRVSQITRVPHAPRPIRGVTNLRGRVIPVIDLRLRLELPPGELERSHRIVVVESRGRLIGLLVDAVRQVVHIDLNRVEPAPDDVMTVQSDYILGVYHQGEELILLLDVDRVLIVKEAGAA